MVQRWSCGEKNYCSAIFSPSDLTKDRFTRTFFDGHDAISQREGVSGSFEMDYILGLWNYEWIKTKGLN